MKEMNIDDWVTPSAGAAGICAEPYGFSFQTTPRPLSSATGLGAPFRSFGFYDEMIGVIVSKAQGRPQSGAVYPSLRSRDCTVYTVMWSNGDLTQNWHRNQLKYACNKKQKTLER